MSLLNAIDAVFIRLSTVPGLGFLHEWVHALQVRKMRREGMIGTYKGYVRSLSDAGSEAKKQMRGPSHGDHGGDSDSGGHGRPDESSDDGRKGRQYANDDDFDEDYEDDDFESYLQ